MITTAEALRVLENDCCGHWTWTLGEPDEVIFSYDNGGEDGVPSNDSYGFARDRSGFILFRKGAEFYVLADWEDYTGHGCRCGGYVRGPFATLDEAKVLGLTDDEREIYAKAVLP